MSALPAAMALPSQPGALLIARLQQAQHAPREVELQLSQSDVARVTKLTPFKVEGAFYPNLERPWQAGAAVVARRPLLPVAPFLSECCCRWCGLQQKQGR